MQKFNEYFNEAKSDSKYQDFVKQMLKKKGYDSIADIPKDKKDDFFNDIDKQWNAEHEPGKDGKVSEGKDTEFKISMNIIKRALGKDVPTKDDLEEFIKMEADKNSFDVKAFSKYVRNHIPHGMTPKGK